MAAFLILILSFPSWTQVRVGAASRTITPDLTKHAPVYIAGFGRNRLAAAIHDELFVRCMAVGAGKEPVVICGVDSIGLFLEDVEKIRSAARNRLGGPAGIVVAALHDHQAPDTMGLWGPEPGKSGINELYNQYVIERTVEAIVEAVQKMRPARVTLAARLARDLDKFINDTRPPAVHDSELVVLSAADISGEPIGTLVNWANHPETLGSKNTRITADFSGYLYRNLEEMLRGTAVFVNGAVGGMQSPLGAKFTDPVTEVDVPEESFRKAEIIGQRVAELAAEALRAAKPVEIDSVEYREKRITIPVSNQNFHMAAKADLFKGRKPMSAETGTATVVGLIRMSGRGKPVLEAALIPGELYPELSVGGVQRYAGADFPDARAERPIKGMMTAPFRMLFGLANDEIGYIIPKAEWDEKEPWLQNAPKRWYGEVNAVGPEAAERIEGAFQSLIGTAGARGR